MISQIVIKIGKKEIILTKKEAFDLKDELNSLLGGYRNNWIVPGYPIYEDYRTWTGDKVICSEVNTGDSVFHDGVPKVKS